MPDCLFCKIVSGEVPSRKIYEDGDVLAFYDVTPQAPVHALVIPKKHIGDLNMLTDDEAGLVGHIFLVVRRLAKELNLTEGYRVVHNCGVHGGQTVAHLHFHLLGGREMLWPPG
ncbi:MAG: histidine triad nucleotide-binding protein [Peptococcaceae bacterium]|jgi:histidine triad (HIT) family protein|nr:histidine triad nucleotide-binding protein [Peptococcaceae bacterium]